MPVLESGRMNPKSTISASHSTDRGIFAALVLIMLCASPRLLAYYRSTQIGPTRVELAAVDAAGTRVELTVPPAIRGQKLRATLADIETFAKTKQAHALTPPAGQLEWTLRYSVELGQVTTRRSRVVMSGR